MPISECVNALSPILCEQPDATALLNPTGLSPTSCPAATRHRPSARPGWAGLLAVFGAPGDGAEHFEADEGGAGGPHAGLGGQQSLPAVHGAELEAHRGLGPAGFGERGEALRERG